MRNEELRCVVGLQDVSKINSQLFYCFKFIEYNKFKIVMVSCTFLSSSQGNLAAPGTIVSSY